jgi:hypothetical protein
MRRTSYLFLLGIACLACGWPALGPQGPASAQNAATGPARGHKDYELQATRAGDTIQAIRFKPATGEAWLFVLDKWSPIPESGPVPPGDFEVTMAARDRDFTAFRLDHRTGVTWLLNRGRWVRLKEPE